MEEEIGVQTLGALTPLPPHQNVNVQKVANGYIVQVGIRTFVFNQIEEVFDKIRKVWSLDKTT